jgi:YVTN family beta-propeller protein
MYIQIELANLLQRRRAMHMTPTPPCDFLLDRRRIDLSIRAFVLALVLLGFVAGPLQAAETPYRSPIDVKFSPDGATVAVADRTGGQLFLVDVKTKSIDATVALKGEPMHVAWAPNGKTLYVSQFGASSVAAVDVAQKSVIAQLPTRRYPKGIALAPKHGLLLAANANTHTVTAINTRNQKVRGEVEVIRNPFHISVSPDESFALVTNLLPAGDATQPNHAAEISFIELPSLKATDAIKLPPGSASLRQVAIHPNGRWAYAVHTLGRTQVPTTQLANGWVNTNALSVIDLNKRELYATMLLDHPLQGAADPWGVTVSPDRKQPWITLAGSQQLANIDLVRPHEHLRGDIPKSAMPDEAYKASYSGMNAWLKIKADPKHRADLVNDLSALYAARLIERIDLDAKGPRGVDLAPDGKLVATGMYYSQDVWLMNAQTSKVVAKIPLGGPRELDSVRLGEQIFHDATYCFQSWLSCASCHPNNGRVDALNWDILNDGIGNPKNVKSMLQAHRTAPMTWRGVRADMETSSKAGFGFMMHQVSDTDLEATREYLRSLTPLPSPHLTAKNKLTAQAKRGLAIFRSAETECADCHSGALLTDQKMHDVGTRAAYDQADKFDTPSLIEIYRTAPYLHNGSVPTLRDMILANNEDDMHGFTSHLAPAQVNDLLAYLLSL